MEELKRCSKCKVPKPLNEFHKRKSSKDGYDHHCKICGNSRHREKYSTDSEYRSRKKHSYIRTVYKLTEAEHSKLISKHNGKCGICDTDFKSKRTTYIDHDHATGKVRGLLCPKCNILLGASMDNIKILQSAISYLKANG
jgi:hypothetical protein